MLKVITGIVAAGLLAGCVAVPVDYVHIEPTYVYRPPVVYVPPPVYVVRPYYRPRVYYRRGFYY